MLYNIYHPTKTIVEAIQTKKHDAPKPDPKQYNPTVCDGNKARERQEVVDISH